MKPTDLIINSDGSIYHLKLRPEEIPDLVLVVGDPGRVETVSCHFDKMEFRRQNREFVSHLGVLNGTRILALSTGIGPDNIDIVLNELDALANIDFSAREPLETHRCLTIVRLGTSGTFYPDIPVGSLAVSTHGLGLDGSLHYYRDLREITDHALTEAFIGQTKWPEFLPKPYIIGGSGDVIKRLDGKVFTGITATACGFYGPQGRELRLKTAFPDMLDAITSFSYNGSRILNFEMETSSLYGLGRMLGHKAASVCVMLANRTTGEYSSHVESDVENLILHVLEQLVP
jgi:uridine phosphorylase